MGALAVVTFIGRSPGRAGERKAATDERPARTRQSRPMRWANSTDSAGTSSPAPLSAGLERSAMAPARPVRYGRRAAAWRARLLGRLACRPVIERSNGSHLSAAKGGNQFCKRRRSELPAGRRTPTGSGWPARRVCLLAERSTRGSAIIGRAPHSAARGRPRAPLTQPAHARRQAPSAGRPAERSARAAIRRLDARGNGLQAGEPRQRTRRHKTARSQQAGRRRHLQGASER